jgi:hypothetical protein
MHSRVATLPGNGQLCVRVHHELDELDAGRAAAFVRCNNPSKKDRVGERQEVGKVASALRPPMTNDPAKYSVPLVRT